MGFDPRIAVSSPPPAPPFLVQQLRSSICSSCCFGGGGGGGGDDDDNEEVEGPASLVSSSAAWLRRKAQKLPLPGVGSRCRRLAARIRRLRHWHRNHHHARASGDFAYDPLSYALNFDEGHEDDGAPGGGEEFRYRSFSSRLPPSPLCAAASAAAAAG